MYHWIIEPILQHYILRSPAETAIAPVMFLNVKNTVCGLGKYAA